MYVAITDHRSHRPGDSFWSLVESVSAQLAASELLVVSRGVAANRPFFESPRTHHRVVGRRFERSAHGFDSDWFEESSLEWDVSAASGVFLRMDRPVSDAFLMQLEKTAPNGRVVNSPTGIVRCGAKPYLLQFADICPGVTIVNTAGQALARAATHGPIVLKPLAGYGGAGILRVSEDTTVDDGDVSWRGGDAERRLEAAFRTNTEGMLAMRYTSRVDQGDKRVLIIGGEPVGAVLRLPRKGGWICNLARGGTVVDAALEPGDIQIARRVGERLVSEGVVLAGIDTLTGDDGGRVLSEINCLNVGGFVQADEGAGSVDTVGLAAAAVLKQWASAGG